MDTLHYWDDNGHSVKFENYNSNDGFAVRGNGCSEQLNFATAPSEDEGEFQPGGGYLKKGKVSRQDPMSHRIIEKRRRDRMNNCLADLSRLIPTEYLKKGRGRVEKTEIIEMAIRHLKYLQDRANATSRQSATEAEHYRAGFKEATSETLRFLVEVQGYGPGDGICVQLSSHLQRHCDRMTKSEDAPPPPCEKTRHTTNGNSSETTSSSGSSHGYILKSGVIARAEPQPAPSRYVEPYETAHEQNYSMECDAVSLNTTSLNADDSEPPSASGSEAIHPDSRRKREQTLRTIRKPEHGEDYLHSYKFKNSIERRFSRSQDNEVDPKNEWVHDMSLRSTQTHPHGKIYSHKRRRAAKLAPTPSTTTSNSGSTEDARDTSPQDTSSESPHNHYEKSAPPPAHFVPVFALNALGKYYVPLSVESACLSRHFGPYDDVLDARAAHIATPLHPVTINVNFQPCLNYHVKREPNDREWRP